MFLFLSLGLVGGSILNYRSHSGLRNPYFGACVESKQCQTYYPFEKISDEWAIPEVCANKRANDPCQVNGLNGYCARLSGDKSKIFCMPEKLEKRNERVPYAGGVMRGKHGYNGFLNLMSKCMGGCQLDLGVLNEERLILECKQGFSQTPPDYPHHADSHIIEFHNIFTSEQPLSESSLMLNPSKKSVKHPVQWPAEMEEACRGKKPLDGCTMTLQGPRLEFRNSICIESEDSKLRCSFLDAKNVKTTVGREVILFHESASIFLFHSKCKGSCVIRQAMHRRDLLCQRVSNNGLDAQKALVIRNYRHRPPRFSADIGFFDYPSFLYNELAGRYHQLVFTDLVDSSRPTYYLSFEEFYDRTHENKGGIAPLMSKEIAMTGNARFRLTLLIIALPVLFLAMLICLAVLFAQIYNLNRRLKLNQDRRSTGETFDRSPSSISLPQSPDFLTLGAQGSPVTLPEKKSVGFGRVAL